MSQKEERVNRVEASLTPQQAVLLWMQEAHRFPNLSELARSLRGQPTSAFPLSRLQDQVVRAVVDATKGQPRPAASQALRQALRDTYFLYQLHVNANVGAGIAMGIWTWRVAALSERLQAMRVEDIFRSFVGHLALTIRMDMPYPLDPETAATVDAAIKHCVSTWDELHEDGTIATWVFDHLVKQGATEIPRGAFKYQGEKCIPTLGPHNENEVRACFRDGSQFERFRAGEDYSNGLANVTDAEFDAHYQSVVSGMLELTNSGQVQVGTVVRLETVPIPFLQEAPLVDGQWLDRHVVELAEWGAVLKMNGYRVAEDEEGHPLTTSRFLGGNGREADVQDNLLLAKTVADDLVKFPGRAREIDGRPYMHFEDYCAWQERRVAGDLPKMLCEGFVTSSWNTWVEKRSSGGAATVAGVPVESLSCYIARHHYQVCLTGAEAMLDSRKGLLDDMRACHSDPDREAELRSDWKATAESLLVEMYSQRECFSLVSRKYYDGQQVLFTDAARDLGEMIGDAEELVGRFNSDFAKKTGSVIDLEALRFGAMRSASQVAASIVDVAKAEALIEVGDRATAFGLMERYL